MGEPKRRGTGQQSLPSPFHPTSVEKRPRRLDALIRQALSFDDEDAYSAGEVGILARAVV